MAGKRPCTNTGRKTNNRIRARLACDRRLFDMGEGRRLDLDKHNLKAWLYGHWHISHVHKHKHAYSIGSLTPIRGGIDHSPASFRMMEVNAHGDFSSELRYPYIDKSLQIASIDNLEAPCTPSGNVQLAVNAYSTVSPVKKVTYEYRVEGKNILTGKMLQQQTDFAWFAEIPMTPDRIGRVMTVRVMAEFGNGEIACAERSFTYRPSSSPLRLQQQRQPVRPCRGGGRGRPTPPSSSSCWLPSAPCTGHSPPASPRWQG